MSKLEYIITINDVKEKEIDWLTKIGGSHPYWNLKDYITIYKNSFTVLKNIFDSSLTDGETYLNLDIRVAKENKKIILLNNRGKTDTINLVLNLVQGFLVRFRPKESISFESSLLNDALDLTSEITTGYFVCSDYIRKINLGDWMRKERDKWEINHD